MTPEDRDLFFSLQREQRELQQAMDRLGAKLDALAARANGAAPETFLPPIPIAALPPPMAPHVPADLRLPPLPADSADSADSAIPAALPPIPPVAPAAAAPAPAAEGKPSLEFHFGRWLTRVGAVCFVLSIIFFGTWIDVQFHLHERLGPWGKLGIMGFVSVAASILGQRLERKRPGMAFFARTLTAAGWAGLYATIYSAYSVDNLKVISDPLIEGLLLLAWSVFVFLMAERKKSQTLALFSITLAYIGTASNPIDHFTMAADLLLAAMAVLFLLRNGWTVLPIFSVVGTYLALLHRLLIDQSGAIILDTSRTLHFLPHAFYLLTAWLLFTLGVILARAPTFHGARRFALLSLNNGAFAGLIALTTYIAGYGYGDMGWVLLGTGVLYMVTSRFAGFADIDPVDAMGAYAAQGLAIFTAGLIVACAGTTRAFALMTETFLLGIAGAFAGDRILTITTYVAGTFATIFAIWEISVYAHHPWTLGFGGAAIMLMNAWACRGEVRHSPRARSDVVLSSSSFCVLAVALVFSALNAELGQNALPPALALAALALTFSIYYISLYELPSIAQILLLIAQSLVLFPADTGEELPWWSSGIVAAVTLTLVTWWSRQRTVRPGPWIVPLNFLYALALVGLATNGIRPYLDDQGWMIGASLLSLAFLIFGAFSRVWSVAAMGQAFLLVALDQFFYPAGEGTAFPWTWLAAAVPIVVVFSTSLATFEWLRVFPDIAPRWNRFLRLAAHVYQLLALAMLVRWVLAEVAPLDQVGAFLFLGTLVLSWNVRRDNPFGIRCSYVLSAFGVVLFLGIVGSHAEPLVTALNGLAMLLFLSQPALLGHEGRSMVTRFETWTLILFSTALAWIFVSAWVWTKISPHYLTLGWALAGLVIFLFGRAVEEKRFRWCGLGMVLAAILRVVFYDMWGLSTGYRVVTFFLLAIITLSIGYAILRRGEHRHTQL